MSNPVSAITGGISLVSGISGAKAAKNSANQQAQAGQASIAEQRRQYDQARTDTAPYRSSGEASNRLLDEYLGTGSGTGGTAATNGFTPLNFDQWSAQHPSNYQENSSGLADFLVRPSIDSQNLRIQKIGYNGYLNANPATAGTNGTNATHNPDIYGSLLKPFSYNDLSKDVVYNNGLQFGLNQGTQAIDNRARASGGYDSGATLKALSNYANDYATTKTEGAYNRNTQQKGQIYDMLNGVANRGVNAVGTVTGSGGTTTNAISNSLEGAGNAQSAGIIGSNNAFQSALTGINGQLPSVFNGNGRGTTSNPLLNNYSNTNYLGTNQPLGGVSYF